MGLKSTSVTAGSIRSHLLLLVLAVSTPLSAVIAYGIDNDMQQSVAYSKASLRTLAKTMVSNTGSKIQNALTQLPNRRLLSDRLNQAMAASNRGGFYGARPTRRARSGTFSRQGGLTLPLIMSAISKAPRSQKLLHTINRHRPADTTFKGPNNAITALSICRFHFATDCEQPVCV